MHRRNFLATMSAAVLGLFRGKQEVLSEEYPTVEELPPIICSKQDVGDIGFEIDWVTVKDAPTVGSRVAANRGTRIFA